MSAHLQFGPEWMRKGAPGSKTPTTPSSESPFTFSDQPNSTKPATTTSSSSSSQQQQQPPRKNLTPSKESGPVPVSPGATPLPSPGGFSFAAAASGSGGVAGNSQSSGGTSNSINGSSFMIGDGDGSRYSKRLLSLYSTERGPKGAAAASELQTQLPAPSPPTGPASSTLPPFRKKGFAERDSAANGRRTHSYNADANHVAKDRFDGHRPGLFQRGNSNSNNNGTQSNTSSGHLTRDRHPSGGGILGGVLSGVTPASSRKNNLQSEDQASAQDGDTSTSSARTPRRERLPGEGPIGPPTDRNGGFVKGFTTDRRRAAGQVPTPTKRVAPNPDLTKDSSANGTQSTDIDLSHHAANLVESLNLDGDEEEQEQSVIQDPTNQTPSWSAENAEWFYRDPSGQVQGPFKANVMQEWYTAKYFQDDLLVRPAEATDFIPLATMLRLIGNSIDPFLIPPSQYAAAQPPLPPPMPTMNAPGQSWPSQAQEQSPFLVNPTLSGLNGQANSPFGTPNSPFADLHGSTNPPQYQNQQQQMEFMLFQQQRAAMEQRNAQMAALAMAQRSGDPSMMAAAAWNAAPQQQQQQPQQPWGHSPQLQYGLPAALGENQMNGWGSPMRQQQQAYQHQIQPPLQLQQPQTQPQPTEQYQDVFTTGGQTDEQPKLTSNETIAEVQNVQEPATEVISEPQPEINTPVEEVKLEEKDTNLSLADQNAAPEHLWPQSPSAVEFASESAVGEVEPLSLPMTTVKGRKARRGEGQKQPIRETSTSPDNAVNAIQTSTAGGLKVMSESDFRKHQSSLQGQNNRTSHSPELSSKNIVQSGSASKAAPWASGNASSNGTSLRDIQEAEAKRAEALRARQQQRPVAVRGDSQTATLNKMTWGLASVPSSTSSTVGATNNAQSPSASNASVGPVWSSTTATKSGPPKKTLTEIQEEERKRAAKSTGVTQAPQMATKTGFSGGIGRGYADLASSNSTAPTNLTSPSAVATSAGGGWAVVGAGGGKPNAANADAPVGIRPNVPSSSPALNKPMIRSISTSSGPNATTTNSSTSSTQPSGEFIRYLKEQLKGLQIKVDDFIEMLLSFPLDPSNDVVEIIAESVYANSSTLDGRRFAADFVAKRKQDAINQKLKVTTPNSFQSSPITTTSNMMGSDLNSSSSMRNASEVLKSQPVVKPVMGNGGNNTIGGGDAFGGFKVVKPKGAKKRT